MRGDQILENLRDIGNTLLVVGACEETSACRDHSLDIVCCRRARWKRRLRRRLDALMKDQVS